MKLGDESKKPFEKGYLGKFDDKAREYELFFDEQSRIKARFPSGREEDFDGHRIQADIRIQTYNYMKESELSGDQIRKGGEVKIRLNNFEVYSFFFRDEMEALLTARMTLQKLYDHPMQFWRAEEREKGKGRKVFYYGHPCTIDYFIWDQGCVILRTEDGKPFPRQCWEEEDHYEKEPTVKDDYLSPHSWWWRK